MIKTDVEGRKKGDKGPTINPFARAKKWSIKFGYKKKRPYPLSSLTLHKAEQKEGKKIFFLRLHLLE